MKIMVVLWKDACHVESGSMPDFVPVMVTSVGYLIKECEEYIVLAGELLPLDDFRQVTVILTSMVISMTEVPYEQA